MKIQKKLWVQKSGQNITDYLLIKKIGFQKAGGFEQCNKATLLV